MASASLATTFTPFNSSFCPKPISRFTSPSLFFFSRSLKSFHAQFKILPFHRRPISEPIAKARGRKMEEYEVDEDDEDDDIEDEEDFDDDNYVDGDGEEDIFNGDAFLLGEDTFMRGLDWAPPIDNEEERPCPPGLRKYETMMVLRPDMSEEERLALTQKYEELLVAGGGMYVEAFNRGVISLSYSIKKRNRAGENNTYMDGIYLLFTYFTRPESITALEEVMKFDDNVIRYMTLKPKKRWYDRGYETPEEDDDETPEEDDDETPEEDDYEILSESPEQDV